MMDRNKKDHANQIAHISRHLCLHSWLACVDYTEKNGAIWDPEKCRGFARNSGNYAQKESFGQDRGFDHKPGQSGNPCKTTYSASSYSNSYPSAIYYPGQQVVLVHPMKNHGATTCTNIHIPDFGSAIYRGNVNTDTDKSYSYYTDKLVASLGTSTFGAANTEPDKYPKQGYQNAPNFCANTDKAMATYSFNIPTDLAQGRYTFVWSWKFNGPSDIYSGCFDVEVAADKTTRDKMLQTRDASIDLSVPCGGETSDGSDGSEVGCSGTVAATTTEPTTTTTKEPIVEPTEKPTTTTTKEATTKSTVVYSTPTVATIGPTTPTLSTKKTTTEGDDDGNDANEYCLPVMGHQFTGSIHVGVPPTSVKRRHLVIDFYCDIESISVWSGRVTEEHGGSKYEIVQDSPNDVARGEVDFFVSYKNCDFARYRPTAKLLWEE